MIISFSLGAGGEKCRRTGILEVKPANSSHLILRTSRVSEAFEVSNLSATVESYAEGDKTFELDIDAEGNAVIPVDPCFAYQIYVTASVGNENNSRSEVISEKFYYNSRVSDRYPYNNELKNEVIDKICLITSDRIRIPDPPTSLKSCVFTKGDRSFFGEPAPTKGRLISGNVEFEITDPHSDFKNPRRICIRTSINQVGSCSKNASISKRETTKLRFFYVDMEVCRNKSSIMTSQVPQSTVLGGESDNNVTGLSLADNNVTDYNVSDYDVTDFNVSDYVVIDHNVTEYNVTGFNVTDQCDQCDQCDHLKTGGILAGLSCVAMLVLAGVTLIIYKTRCRKDRTAVPQLQLRDGVDENPLYGSYRPVYADLGSYAGLRDGGLADRILEREMYYAGPLDD